MTSTALSSAEPTTQPDGSAGPLHGLRVIDLTRALAGPHAAMMLGDLGADVIKIESPAGGDDTRGWGPPFVEPAPRPDQGGPREDDRESTYFLSANRNKKSVTLDLKSDAGKTALRALIATADVLMENFRTGVLDRLGFSTERLAELNPRLVVLSISGFGHDGPEGGRAGYDQIAQGEAGLMSLTGSGPDDVQRVGVPIADLLAGMYGAFGVLAALREREHTGKGRVVRTSLLAGVVGVHAFQGTRWTVAGEVGTAQGNHHPSICPYGLFHTADGAVQISVGSEGLWRRFCSGFRLDAAAAGMATNPERVENRKQVMELIEDVFGKYTTADLLVELDRIGIPAGRVRSVAEVYEWDQTRSQGLLIDVEHATLGTITLPGPPLRFFEAGGTEVTRTHHLPPPVLGADNDLIATALRAGLR
ncbi:CaiB/BaiF CoA transferase family protein [Mycobacterium sp. NPDC003449]